MEPITLITGAPGTGKTAVSDLRAQRSESGVHIPSDIFSSFPGRRIPPPPSRAGAMKATSTASSGHGSCRLSHPNSRRPFPPSNMLHCGRRSRPPGGGFTAGPGVYKTAWSARCIRNSNSTPRHWRGISWRPMRCRSRKPMRKSCAGRSRGIFSWGLPQSQARHNSPFSSFGLTG